MTLYAIGQSFNKSDQWSGWRQINMKVEGTYSHSSDTQARLSVMRESAIAVLLFSHTVSTIWPPAGDGRQNGPPKPVPAGHLNSLLQRFPVVIVLDQPMALQGGGKPAWWLAPVKVESENRKKSIAPLFSPCCRGEFKLPAERPGGTRS